MKRKFVKKRFIYAAICSALILCSVTAMTSCTQNSSSESQTFTQSADENSYPENSESSAQEEKAQQSDTKDPKADSDFRSSEETKSETLKDADYIIDFQYKGTSLSLTAEQQEEVYKLSEDASGTTDLMINTLFTFNDVLRAQSTGICVKVTLISELANSESEKANTRYMIISSPKGGLTGNIGSSANVIDINTAEALIKIVESFGYTFTEPTEKDEMYFISGGEKIFLSEEDSNEILQKATKALSEAIYTQTPMTSEDIENAKKEGLFISVPDTENNQVVTIVVPKNKSGFVFYYNSSVYVLSEEIENQIRDIILTKYETTNPIPSEYSRKL